MFRAIHKITKDVVNTLVKEYDPKYMSDEEWYADPYYIEQVAEGIDINTIIVRYRRRSKEYINENGTLCQRQAHFYIPNAEQLGVRTRPESKEHKQAEAYIQNLFLEKTPIIISEIKQGNIMNTFPLDYELFELSKCGCKNIEVPITDESNTRVLDILLPLKEPDKLLGYGICIEIQFTKQTCRVRQEREFDRATKGYSVCWLTPDDFVDINDENLQLKENVLKIYKIEQIFHDYKNESIQKIKQITIEYVNSIMNRYNIHFDQFVCYLNHEKSDIITQINQELLTNKEMQDLVIKDIDKLRELHNNIFREIESQRQTITTLIEQMKLLYSKIDELTSQATLSEYEDRIASQKKEIQNLIEIYDESKEIAMRPKKIRCNKCNQKAIYQEDKGSWNYKCICGNNIQINDA